MSAPTPSDCLPFVRADQLAHTPPEERWLIESLWADQGVGVIGGSAKSLKTWLGLEMAVSVATGTDCLGTFKVPHKGRVLLYLAEDCLTVGRERLDALCAHRQLALDTLDAYLITAPLLRLDDPLDIKRLEHTLTHLRPRLLLLDPFVRLHQADENNSQAVASILATLRELQRVYSLAIILVHHTRKNGRARQHGQTLRGSGDLHAWGASNLYLTHEKNTLKVTIEHRAAPPPKPFHMALVGSPPHLDIVTSGMTPPPSLEERIVMALEQSPVPLRRTELRALLSVNNQRLGNVLCELETVGRIRRSKEGWRR